MDGWMEEMVYTANGTDVALKNEGYPATCEKWMNLGDIRLKWNKPVTDKYSMIPGIWWAAISIRIQDCIQLFLLGASLLLVEPLLSKELVESKAAGKGRAWLLEPPEVMGGLNQQ